MNRETGPDRNTLLPPCIKQTTDESLLYSSRELYSLFCGDLNRKEILKKTGYMYTRASPVAQW